MVSKGKALLIAAFLGLGGLMLFFVLYADSFQPKLEQITISAQSIKLKDVDKINNRADLEIDWVLSNPTTVTSTISTIDYTLYANGQNVGEGHYSVDNIPMAGRPALFAGSNATVPDTLKIIRSDSTGAIYDSIVSGNPVKYELKGQVTIESNLTLITKDFDVKLG